MDIAPSRFHYVRPRTLNKGFNLYKETVMSYAHSTFRHTAYLLLTLCIALAGCANQKEPAQKAIASIEAAVAAVGADAQSLIPDALKAVNDQLAELKAKFDKQDYAAVLAAAPALLTQAQGLVAAKDTAMREAAAKAAAAQQAAEDALKASWAMLVDAVPAAIAAVDSQIATLTKAKKLPANVTKDALAAAQTSLADAKSLWTQATGAQSAGKWDDAVASAQQAKEKVGAAMAGLGMTSPLSAG